MWAFWRWCAGNTRQQLGACVCVRLRNCLPTERGMFPTIPACFLAPIVPFVLYYLRSVTHLLLRIGSNRQGRAQQPASIVFLRSKVASRSGWSSFPPAPVCFCLGGSGTFSVRYQRISNFLSRIAKIRLEMPFMCGAVGLFSFSLVVNKRWFGLPFSASVHLCFFQSCS